MGDWTSRTRPHLADNSAFAGLDIDSLISLALGEMFHAQLGIEVRSSTFLEGARQGLAGLAGGPAVEAVSYTFMAWLGEALLFPPLCVRF